MIKENQKLLNRIQVVLDAGVIIVAYVLSWYIRFRSGLFDLDPWYLSLREYMKVLFFLVPSYLILYYAFQLYTPKRVQGRRLEAWHVVQANVIGLMGVTMVFFLAKLSDRYSRWVVFIFCFVNITMEVFARNMVRMVLRKARKNGYNQKHMILVGYSRAAEQYIDRILANPEWGYAVRGILDDHQPRGMEYKGIKVIGSIDNLLVILPQNQIDEIAITLGLDEYHKLEYIVNMCEKSGVHTKFIPDYNNIIPTKPYTEDIQGLPVINIRHVPLNNALNKFVKRAVDIFGAIVAIILFSPVMLVASVLIKLTAPGPLIFKQERIGLQNKPFYMYKFRSMIVQKESEEKKGWTTKDDPRVTPVGKFIRKTSIDELPQFYNVLKGDMSLVGTRPPTVDEFRQYESHQKRRLSAKPGITGLWQVSGRNEIKDFEDVVKLDVQYIDNWSIGLDIKIILKTIKVVFEKGGE